MYLKCFQELSGGTSLFALVKRDKYYYMTLFTKTVLRTFMQYMGAILISELIT